MQKLLQRLLHPANRYWLALLAIIMIAGYFFFMGYTLGYEEQSNLEQKLYNKSLTYDEINQRNRKLTDENQQLKSNLQVEQDTRETLQQTLIEQTKDLYALKQQIAFYQKIITPKDKQRGLTIYDIQLQPTNNPNQFTMILILAQPGYQRSTIEGQVVIKVTGYDADQDAEHATQQTLALQDISAEPQLRFRFTYFQTIEIPITFPAMFTVESIEVKAKTTGNVVQHAKLKKLWSDLILD